MTTAAKEALESLEALSKAIFDYRSTRSPAEIQDDIETIRKALTPPTAPEVEEAVKVVEEWLYTGFILDGDGLDVFCPALKTLITAATQKGK